MKAASGTSPVMNMVRHGRHRFTRHGALPPLVLPSGPCRYERETEPYHAYHTSCHTQAQAGGPHLRWVARPVQQELHVEARLDHECCSGRKELVYQA